MCRFQNCKCICCFKKMIDSNVSKGIQANYTGQQTILTDNQIVPFNNVLNNQTDFISMNNGIFTTNKSGNYLVTFWICVDGSDSFSKAYFSVNGIQSCIGVIQGQLNGSTLLTLNVGDTIKLTNTSTQSILVADVPVKAQITIIKL